MGIKITDVRPHCEIHIETDKAFIQDVSNMSRDFGQLDVLFATYRLQDCQPGPSVNVPLGVQQPSGKPPHNSINLRGIPASEQIHMHQQGVQIQHIATLVKSGIKR